MSKELKKIFKEMRKIKKLVRKNKCGCMSHIDVMEAVKKYEKNNINRKYEDDSLGHIASERKKSKKGRISFTEKLKNRKCEYSDAFIGHDVKPRESLKDFFKNPNKWKSQYKTS